MFKKSVIAVLVAGAVGLAAPVQARADVSSVTFHLGVVTSKNLSFDPFLFVSGLNFDLNFGSALFLAADIDLIAKNFYITHIWLNPSATLNLDLNGFYFGAGFSKFFLINGDNVLQTSLLLKANVGFRSFNTKFQVFAYTPLDDLGGTIGFGATIGFGL